MGRNLALAEHIVTEHGSGIRRTDSQRLKGSNSYRTNRCDAIWRTIPGPSSCKLFVCTNVKAHLELGFFMALGVLSRQQSRRIESRLGAGVSPLRSLNNSANNLESARQSCFERANHSGSKGARECKLSRRIRQHLTSKTFPFRLRD